MIKKSSFFIIITVIIFGFGVGIYLQDRKHHESTATYWRANRHNIKKFRAVERYNNQMNADNWQVMKENMRKELDSLIILRFRKEMDSLNALGENN